MPLSHASHVSRDTVRLSKDSCDEIVLASCRTRDIDATT
jgi:hypothetical protein